jgi:hypothetical protein
MQPEENAHVDADAQLEALMDLETRHDDLLTRLDALDRRIKTVLSDCMPGKVPAEGVEAVAEPA